MATDGVKIIEGDLAYDLYAHFMDMYNKGANTEKLQKQFLSDKESCSFNKFDYEICLTVYALAFWEIGELTEEMLNEVKTVVEEKATVNYWTNEFGKEVGDERQEELDKFLEKISTPNSEPKKRKKYKIVNLFKVGDVLSFQYPDNTYGAAFVVEIEKLSGLCSYSICRTKYKSEQQPTMENFVQNTTFYAGKVPTMGTNGKMTHILLAWINSIEHKDLEKFAFCFSKIGNIKFQLQSGQSLTTSDYQDFCDNSQLESQISYTKKVGGSVEEYPVREYIKQ